MPTRLFHLNEPSNAKMGGTRNVKRKTPNSNSSLNPMQIFIIQEFPVPEKKNTIFLIKQGRGE